MPEAQRLEKAKDGEGGRDLKHGRPFNMLGVQIEF